MTVTGVSIHAPRAGRDAVNCYVRYCTEFQSTRPARGATRRVTAIARLSDVSIHAPRAGRDARTALTMLRQEFQSTRPARGATITDRARVHAINVMFQSTRPARGATKPFLRVSNDSDVSIHAPRAGRDRDARSRTTYTGFNPRAPRGARRSVSDDFIGASCFNPRAPRGARRTTRIDQTHAARFQSTRPARGATRPARLPPRSPVSIHAPRAGRDALSLDTWAS